MIFSEVSENNFIAKISNDIIENIDIFDIDEVENFIKNLFKEFIKKHKLKGEVELDIYINNYYGMIIDIKTDNDFLFEDEVNVRIMFHLNNIFLYEIDYFDILENTNIRNCNVYYYNDKFYLEITCNIDDKDYFTLLESSNILWDDTTMEIVKNGVKLTI